MSSGVSPPDVPSWEARAGVRSVVYFTPGAQRAVDADAVSRRLDDLLGQISRDSGLDAPGLIVYPLYPSAERFREEWWRFATLADGMTHGWGTIVADGVPVVSPYQVARVVAGGLGPGIPMLIWGLGDLIADRQAGVNSHAHARLFTDRAGLQPVKSIIHQLDFSQALPGSHAQGVSFLAYLAEEHGLPGVIAFAQAVGRRWYDFESLFQTHFAMSVADADRRWRRRVAGAPAPELTDSQYTDYRDASEFVYRTILARSPGGLVSRPGGAEAYVAGVRAADALRRFDVAAAAQAAQVGRHAADATGRRTVRARLGIQIALWGLALAPVVLVVFLLAGPAVRSAWRDRRAGRRRRRSTATS